MNTGDLERAVEAAWEARETLSPKTGGAAAEAVETALALLDSGKARVAEKQGDGWIVNQWLKKAVLLSFRLQDMEMIPGGPGADTRWYDKVPSKFAGWDEARFREAGFRAVPSAIVRRSAYVAPGVVLMPSFVNIGAYVDSGTMIDTWATVGSCAQIGKNCHISGGAGIGGVLEPLQVSSSSRARCWRWVSLSEHPPGSSTARPARSIAGASPPTRWWCRARCRAGRCRTARRVPASIAR